MARPAGKLVAHVMLQCTLRQAMGIFELTGGMMSSVSGMHRLMDQLHGAWRAMEADALSNIRSKERIPDEALSFSVQLDGAMVLLLPREGNRDRTGQNWREAACGTLSHYDAQGKRLRTISHGRMPQVGKTDLKHWLAQESSHALKSCRGSNYSVMNRTDLPTFLVCVFFV